MHPVTPNEWLAPIRERGLLPADSVSSLLVGSSARGWSNARSDHDVYVITANEWIPKTCEVETIAVPLDPPLVRAVTFHHQSKRWEVTYWAEQQVEQMLAKVSWTAYEEGQSAAASVLSVREELLLGRLASARPLTGETWLKDTRRRLTASAFRSFLVVRSLGEADDAVEDALGQMEADDLDSAVLSARIALGHSVNALLESHGDYDSHTPKWQANRFRATAPEVLTFDRYWSLETMRDFDTDNPHDWIMSVLAICQDIAMRVETS